MTKFLQAPLSLQTAALARAIHKDSGKTARFFLKLPHDDSTYLFNDVAVHSPSVAAMLFMEIWSRKEAKLFAKQLLLSSASNPTRITHLLRGGLLESKRGTDVAAWAVLDILEDGPSEAGKDIIVDVWRLCHSTASILVANMSTRNTGLTAGMILRIVDGEFGEQVDIAGDILRRIFVTDSQKGAMLILECAKGEDGIILASRVVTSMQTHDAQDALHLLAEAATLDPHAAARLLFSVVNECIDASVWIASIGSSWDMKNFARLMLAFHARYSSAWTGLLLRWVYETNRPVAMHLTCSMQDQEPDNTASIVSGIMLKKGGLYPGMMNGHNAGRIIRARLAIEFFIYAPDRAVRLLQALKAEDSEQLLLDMEKENPSLVREMRTKMQSKENDGDAHRAVKLLTGEILD